MGQSWNGSGLSNLWTAKRPAEDGRTLRLAVEALPDGAWDWVVWPEGQGRACRSGLSATRAAAIAAAEAVAGDMAGAIAWGHAAD